MNAEEAEATRIYDLLKAGDRTEFLRKREEGFDIDGYYFSQGGTLLYKAIWESNEPLVDFLLDNGANTNTIIDGNNAFYPATLELDIPFTIFKKLIDAGTWVLPFFPSKKTVLDVMLLIKPQLEDEIDGLQYELQEEEELYQQYLNNNNYSSNNTNNSYGRWRGGGRKQKGGMTLNEIYLQKRQQLASILEKIAAIQPVVDTNVRAMKIDFLGSPRSEDLSFDMRAPVKELSIHIYNFFMDNTDPLNFKLVMPSFHLKNKRVLDDERALSDYGIRNGTKIVVIINMSSQRHGGKQRKTKTRRAKKSNRKTRRR
jgi:hypothetical protein